MTGHSLANVAWRMESAWVREWNENKKNNALVMCGVPYTSLPSLGVNNRSKQEDRGGSKELQTWPRKPALNIWKSKQQLWGYIYLNREGWGGGGGGREEGKGAEEGEETPSTLNARSLKVSQPAPYGCAMRLDLECHDHIDPIRLQGIDKFIQKLFNSLLMFSLKQLTEARALLPSD